MELNKKLKTRLERGEHPQGKLERWALSALIINLEKKQDLDGLANLHAKLWSNPQYLSYYDQIVDRNKRGFAMLKEELLAALSTLTTGTHTINRLVEFGCGNGWLLNQLSYIPELHAINEFVGLDINDSQINKNRKAFEENGKLKFIHGDITAMLKEDLGERTVYFTFGGVLEYLNGKQFEELIQLIADKKSSALMFFEPIEDAQALESQDQTKVFGVELSFSHPYSNLIRKGGFQIVVFKTIYWIGGDWVFVVAAKN
ncbi:class I SAM-dependent methyltransferase [Mongoliitalea daihaiensis]|uniref:class I SAM-dependent methyltransferase n=1 Tax=Mongoliitalea daihaiensis TaxID=2782006 RepID=UPI001F3C7436|nr:class I SAM-dependent methyltransferase [Mongoliitalea daihaiensis]UJP66880.1 class I SAM-dependent methyltransferase [Mongoliitalea daihaiensis]